MNKRITFKEALFILPILIIIGVFSVWPILKSVQYTVFDYQLNDQQKSQMFLESGFNTEVFCEETKYINFYLKKDMKEIEDVEEINEFERIRNYVGEMQSQFEDKEPVIYLSNQELEPIEAFIHMLQEDIERLYQASGEHRFPNEENIQVILDNLGSSFIESNFIGLKGYAQVLQDERFFLALKNTLYFTIISVLLEFVLGLGLALIMNKAMRGIGIIRTVSLIPWAIPTAVSALIWSYMYDGGSGIIAKFFTDIGLVDSPEQLLLTGGGAMACAIIADVWKTTPYMALLLLGGLQTIDGGLYESAQIDGAGKIRTFMSITLPLLKPSILVALLFRTLDAFRVYDLIAVLTGGGPGGSTETLSIYAYKTMFGQTNFGYGSIIVLMMFVCVAMIAILFVKILGTDLISKD